MALFVCALSLRRMAEELVRSKSIQMVVLRRNTQTSPFPHRRASRVQHAPAHAGRGGVGSPGGTDNYVTEVLSQSFPKQKRAFADEL